MTRYERDTDLATVCSEFAAPRATALVLSRDDVVLGATFSAAKPGDSLSTGGAGASELKTHSATLLCTHCLQG